MELDARALDRQALEAATKYSGSFAPFITIVMVMVIAGYAANLWLFAAGVTPLWLATLLLAALSYLAYTPLHEAAHGNICGGQRQLKWVENLTGFAAAQIIFLPHSTHRLEHMVHHRYTNDPERDPDFLASRLGNGWVSFSVMALRFFWNGFSYAFRDECTNSTRKDKTIFLTEITVALGWRAAFLTQVPLVEGLILLVGGYTAAVYFTVYWFAYRPHHPYDTAERYRNTNSLIMPTWMRPFRWFWMNQDLHSIHHLFPRVPFYHYRKLFNEIEPILRAKGTPIIGIFDRAPVPASAQVAGASFGRALPEHRAA
jgi:beta-carotene hydroxylase